MSIELISGILLIVVAGLAWGFGEKNQFQSLKIVHFIFALFALFSTSALVDHGHAEHHFLAMLGGVMVLHLVGGFFVKLKNDWLITGIIMATGLVLLVVPEGHVHFNEHEVLSNSIHGFIALTMGAIMLPLIQEIEKKSGKFFKLDFKSQRGISRSLFFVYIGIALLMCGFFLSLGGWAFFMVGFSSLLFYNKRSGAVWNVLLAVIVITMIAGFSQLADVEVSSILAPKVLLGILTAGFIALLMNTLTRARKKKKMAAFLGLVLAGLATMVLLFGQNINVQFGGFDAFIGLLLGFGLTSLYGINIKKNVVLHGGYIGIGLIYLGLFQQDVKALENKFVPAMENVDEAQNTKAVVLDIQGIFELKGHSKLGFELGQAGAKTKGAFKEIEGTMTAENGTLKADVVLPVASITTFNQYRDESLMEESYFNVAEYPVISFKGKEIGKEGETHVLKGEFIMLGKVHKEEVRLEYLGIQEGKYMFRGWGKIDRTIYGMKPDPKEGNLVDFQVELAFPQK